MNLMDGGELNWPTAHVVPAARVHNHVIACALVEIWMVGYLLVIGVKTREAGRAIHRSGKVRQTQLLTGAVSEHDSGKSLRLQRHTL